MKVKLNNLETNSLILQRKVDDREKKGMQQSGEYDYNFAPTQEYHC